MSRSASELYPVGEARKRRSSQNNGRGAPSLRAAGFHAGGCGAGHSDRLRYLLHADRSPSLRPGLLFTGTLGVVGLSLAVTAGAFCLAGRAATAPAIATIAKGVLSLRLLPHAVIALALARGILLGALAA